MVTMGNVQSKNTVPLGDLHYVPASKRYLIKLPVIRGRNTALRNELKTEVLCFFIQNSSVIYIYMHNITVVNNLTSTYYLELYNYFFFESMDNLPYLVCSSLHR